MSSGVSGNEEGMMENYVMADERYVKDLEESLELCEKSYAEVNTNLILLEEENRALKVKVAQLEAQVLIEQDRNLGNVGIAEVEIGDLRRDLEEVTRYAKKFAGEVMDLRAENLKLGYLIKLDRYMRGGSWYDDLVSARAVYRSVNAPGNRDNDVGFRVVK